MKKQFSTKRALLLNLTVMLLCVSMLVGSTFAWFTDTASTAVNTVRAGDLKVDIQDMSGETLQGKLLKWKTADNREQSEILWEPGCTYALESFQVVNNGSLALRFRIAVSGIEGNPHLLEALEFTISHKGNINKIDGNGLSTYLDAFECILLPAGSTTENPDELVATSGEITISAHMKESAGNDYMNETIDGIAIVVTASQYTWENDSNGNTYDNEAHAHSFRATVTPATCTEGGYTTYECNFCDVSEVRDQVAPLGHNIVNGVCARCGYTVYREEGEYVYFGSYPQTKVTDEALIETLNAQTKNADNDVTYGTEKYRFANGGWYRYDPIKWRVCNKNAETGEAYLLADSILHVMSYYNGNEVGISPNYKNERQVNGETVYSANYQYSDVRKWLTETFYPTAFNADQKQIVLRKTNAAEGSYTGRSMSDDVFLPSYSELKNYVYGGVSNSYLNNYTSKGMTAFASVANGSGSGYWLTRSGIDAGGHSSAKYNVMTVSSPEGNVYGNYRQMTINTNGVVPAMWVVLQ